MADFILIGIIAAAVVLALRTILRRKKNGGCGCGCGGCSKCAPDDPGRRVL